MKSDLLFQTNIRKSFHFVKEDIEKLSTEQERLKKKLELLESMQKRMLYSFASAPPTAFIGDIITHELHREDCLLLASIENVNKISFTNKFEARQRGFSECLCLF